MGASDSTLKGGMMGAASMNPWMALGGAGAGLASYFLNDKPEAEKQNKLLAAKYAMSGYNHQTPNDKLATANPFQDVMQFGTTGAMVGAGMDREAAASAKDAAMTKYYNQGGPMSASNYWSVPAMSEMEAGPVAATGSFGSPVWSAMRAQRGY